MARAVNVRIVTLCGLVLNVCGVDGDAALLLFRSLVDLIILHNLSFALQSENLGDCSGKGGLAVVDMADGANVNMRQVSYVLFLCHCVILLQCATYEVITDLLYPTACKKASITFEISPACRGLR